LRSINAIKKRKFGALVVDYDGTICDSENRFTGQGSETLAALVTLLENEITLGIATGRGQSVRNDLQRFVAK
jgi:hydroxymethylpyrimidine pyrophosphatase-like HAD family hydrolase